MVTEPNNPEKKENPQKPEGVPPGPPKGVPPGPPDDVPGPVDPPEPPNRRVG